MLPLRIKDWVVAWNSGAFRGAILFAEKLQAEVMFERLKKAAGLAGVELQKNDQYCWEDHEQWVGFNFRGGFQLELRRQSNEEILKRYPRICGHMICESLGYASAMLAAKIVADGARGTPNYCEWIDSCYQGNARTPLESAIRGRHNHSGYMAEYGRAQNVVRRAVECGESGVASLGAWF